MEPSRRIAILLGAAVFFITLALYFTLAGKSDLSPQPASECKVLHSSHDGALNILFIADEKTSKSYTDYLLKSEPYSLRKNDLNIYYLYADISEDCQLYKGIAAYCYSKPLLEKAASCPSDIIIVPQMLPANIRSSSYRNVISLNKNSDDNVLLHEMGHAIAHLAEEYLTDQSPPAGSQNCQTSCEDFNIRDGCFEGCSSSRYFRSIDNGVMRTLDSSAYGVFNNQLLNNKISGKISSQTSPITGNAVASLKCQDSSYYLITMEERSGKLALTGAELKDGCAPGSISSSSSYQLKDSEGNALVTNGFSDNVLFTDVQMETESQLSGETYYVEEPFYLTAPQDYRAAALELFNPQGDSLLQTDLSRVGGVLCEI